MSGNRSEDRCIPWAALAALVGTIATGCALDDVPFPCEGHAQCRTEGAQGLCEPAGYCSFADAACPSGRRFAPLAPSELRERCVPSGCIEGIAVGERHACLRTQDDVYCWGQLAGELDTSPRRLVAPRGSLVALASGALHACVIHGESYDVTCFGDNSNGQLGVLDTDEQGPIDVDIAASGGRDFTNLALGGAHSCAFREMAAGAGRQALCWGKNDDGELNVEGTTRVAPVPPPENDDLAELALGEAHTCDRTGDGKVRCWGRVLGGGEPNGNEPSSPVPAMVALPEKAAELALGARHSCARVASGDVYCWGDGNKSQLGSGDEASLEPVKVDIGGPRALHIAAGSNHTCAALEDGRVACWGASNAWQLGPGTSLVPGLAPGVFYLGKPVAEISAGGDTTCALTQGSHDVYCWGSGSFGQLGNGLRKDASDPDPTLTRSVSCPF